MPSLLPLHLDVSVAFGIATIDLLCGRKTPNCLRSTDSVRYRVAEVHRDAEYCRQWKSICPRRKRGRCSLLECVSNGRRRRVDEDGKSPLDLRPHPLLFDLLLGHPPCSLCASSVRCCRRHRICWRREVRIMRHFLARSLAMSRSASATPPTRDTAPVASLLPESAQIVPNKAFAWHS